MLKELFIGRQEQMKAFICQKLLHPVEKGDNSENAWINFFNEYLPNRYRCDKGHVIDSKDNQSEQIDVIIYDNYFSPFLLNSQTTKYIPAESVYAVFEVKQDLSRKNFEYAQKKVASVRILHRTSASVIANGETYLGRQPFNIIGGLLTFNNNWKAKLEEWPVNHGENTFLDIGCCINDRCWMYRTDDNTGTNKYCWNNNSDETLLSFWMELLHELQLRGSVSAMEIPKYFNGFLKD